MMRALVAGLVLASAPAVAGPSQFGWLGTTELLAARDAEPQVRITDQNDLGVTRIRETTLWAGVQVGITDRLELTLPIEATWSSAVGIEPQFALQRYGAEVRYRFVDRKSCLVPVLRVGLHDDLVRRSFTRGELDGTLSYTRGRLLVGGELGLTTDASTQSFHLLIRTGAGAGFEVRDKLRVGAEIHAEIDRESGGTSWVVAGPSLAWRHGGFWLAVTYAIGLSNIDSAPRLLWGGSF
jgi:hypothetical protein